MDNHFPRVELLAPAGSREAFTGAVSAGADAVYLGGEKFGARAYAENFSNEDLVRVIGEAHLYGRRVYLTANVLTREEELGELTDFVRSLWLEGLDGVIIQDLGVVAALREACPGLPLHASTQMSVTSSEAVQYLRRMGISRVVPARELSLEEISALRREDAAINGEPVEIESFIHGAMCYSYSGRCLMSSFLGGRSGNRGRCAGTCRLPYRVLDDRKRPVGPDANKKEVYPLSMKDMCVLSMLPDLIDAGITSFKIEGRMKKPVYAAGVTAIYRKYIDRCYAWMEAGRPGAWQVEAEDLEKLRALYIRTDLGTGYYRTARGRDMITIGKPGYAGTDAGLEEEIRRKYLGDLPKRPIRGRAVFKAGQPASLTVSADGWGAGPGCVAAGVTGMEVQPASGKPLDPADLDARLRKTGTTPFVFSALDIEADESIFLPVSAVNALRREALEKLQDLAAAAGRAQGQGVFGQDASGQEKQTPVPEEQDLPGREVSPAEAGADADGAAGPAPAERAFREGTRAAEPASGAGGPELWALVSSYDQLQAAVRSGCSCILYDGDYDGEFDPEEPKTHLGNIYGVKSKNIQPEKIRLICVLPPVFRVSDRERIRLMIRNAKENGFSGIMVRTLEELETARELAYEGEIIADHSLYSWNSRSMETIARDCGRLVCSLEMNEAWIREAAEKMEEESGISGRDRLILPVYGRVPMMETANCVRRTEKVCSGTGGFAYLEDRRGKKLPVRCRCGSCSNTIYNAVPLSLHPFAGKGLMAELPVHLCMFTDESPEQTQRILEFFKALQLSGRGRKRTEKKKEKKTELKTELTPPFEEYTRGHFRSGAL